MLSNSRRSRQQTIEQQSVSAVAVQVLVGDVEEGEDGLGVRQKGSG